MQHAEPSNDAVINSVSDFVLTFDEVLCFLFVFVVAAALLFFLFLSFCLEVYMYTLIYSVCTLQRREDGNTVTANTHHPK